MEFVAVNGSYRDPAGKVYKLGNRYFRSVTASGADAFKLLTSSSFIADLVNERLLVPFESLALDRSDLPLPEGTDLTGLLELQPIEFVSHPYEWTFGALKQAALLHLEIQLRALEHDISLVDASAYNLQFLGPRPIFIDHLSFRPYAPDSLWVGHRQFCEQFLNPLLLQSVTGVPFHPWYRGALEGIPGRDLRRLLPLTAKLTPRVITHVVLPDMFDRRQPLTAPAANASDGRLPKPAFAALLRGLKRWIAGLHPKTHMSSSWRDYEATNSYASEDSEAKRRFVAAFVSRTRPRTVWDLGCNTGAYAALALENGAAKAIGFDSDGPALEAAFGRAVENDLNFLPLFQEFHNPSPNQGWREHERDGLSARAPADAVLALALIHHLAISRNVPLDSAVGWIIGLAPQGIIEFVPKSDPMVRTMLAGRSDIFDDYNEDSFTAAIAAQARIVGETQLQSGRRLVCFDRS